MLVAVSAMMLATPGEDGCTSVSSDRALGSKITSNTSKLSARHETKHEKLKVSHTAEQFTQIHDAKT